MNRRARLPLAVAALGFLIACQGDHLTRPIDQPLYAVSDGAHDGNPDFFFLPPMFKHPSNDPDFDAGAFNANLRPVVEICQLGELQPDDSRSCVAGPPVERFAGSDIGVSTADEQYHVNWHTDESNLIADQFYRITVLVGGAALGFADVDPVSTGKELRNVQTGEYIGLVDGRTLPIKFRIENGALCTGEACAATTVTLPEGGGVELEAEGERFRFDVEAGTEGDFGGQTITEVTFNIEPCDGIDVDLRKFGVCLRVTTFFDAAAGQAELVLNNPVLISMCILEPGIPEGQEELITLHQQDGELIRALPHAAPNCGDALGARTQEAPSFAARGWRWIRGIAADLFTPQPLYARSRMVVFDVGGGGESDRLGAQCSAEPTATRMALVECPAFAPQLAAAATASAAKTVSDFQFALPAKMDYVDSDDASRSAPSGTSLPTAVKVTDWSDEAVQGATVTFTVPGSEGPIGTAISDDRGIAEISWPIAGGANALVATGRGIAAQNNYPDATVTPFMPDIHSTDEQEPVVLRNGAVPFAATGTTADLTVTSFTQSPVEPTTADLITFTAVVTNVGDGPAGPSTAGIDVGGEPAPGETFAVPALAPGASFTVTREMILEVAQGYVNFARADVNNAVAESNEGNNEQSLSFVVTAAALISCQTSGATGGDLLDRGFYIPTYPGTTLGRVEMFFSSNVAGDYTISLTARANTYDGPLIGTATAAVTLPANQNTFVQGTFTIASAAFAPGSAVTFALAQVSGPSTTVFYEVPSNGNEACPIVQTNGTEAPLSTFRRNGVEVRVFPN